MRRIEKRILGIALVVSFLLSPVWTPVAQAAVDPAAKCIDGKLRTAAGLTKSILNCHASATRRGQPVNPNCLDRAQQRFDKRMTRAEDKGGCPTQGDAPIVASFANAQANRALISLTPNGPDGSKCSGKKLSAAAKRAFKTASAHGKNVRNPNLERLVRDIDRAIGNFDDSMARAENKGDCQTLGDANSAGATVDSGADAIFVALTLVGSETTSIASGAEPAETPGTAGVDANDYPNLVTQFGGSSFNLNRATYTRYFATPDGSQPDAILILVPGFEGGATSFKILGENLVTRSLENGLRVEVWAYDRRGNQLEDREGFAIARANEDPLIALDWYYGDDLGLTLSPELVAGPNRRAFFHDTHADTAFIANWTPLVLSRDIDALVEAARSQALNQNVFLGGHSAGTGFTARYAATDFDLSGLGPVEAGYAKLRGLVLLEGGGGSAGAPLTEDQLDRIEDKADGGQFAAVRDNAPRCSDGTPCTVATEAVDCAGIGQETCTEPVAAYSVVAGLLNPHILASAEPGVLQPRLLSDTEQVILQVDQGAPGNNAIAMVPELAPLALIPQSTPDGALGTFIDDDGFISSFAVFVRTSVGAPGPVVGGLLTWLDLSDGPMPPSAVPDNGAAPVALPADEWGPELEVSRIDRVGTTFEDPDTNFTDWYYPSSGLSTTSGIGLDSTQLSVGRGRRDIENLTQAGNIDIPVICFGGANGLTPVPGEFVSFASTLATCATPSCDGTARVVDAGLPNPAFPTLGDINGGFEVHINTGYAHVDVVTSEDDGNNQVVGPLIDFLERNLQ